jgi:tetratricopeptide (TPR) repeat protein
VERALSYRDADTAMTAARRAFETGDVTSTEQICKQVLAFAPERSDVWALLTETALRRNRLDAAIVCADRAAALDPKDPIVDILRAKCRFFAGDIGAAVEAAEQASRNGTSAPDVLDALGAIFGMLGQHQRALEPSRRAVAARPRIAQYVFNLAATERMLGQLDAAERHCNDAVAIDPSYCLARYLRSDLRIATPDRNHIAEMEAALRKEKLPPADEILLRFALGKECEDIGQYGRAFEHVAAANELHRASIDYDPKAEIADIDRIIGTQSRSWLASCRQGFRQAKPIFVVGLPRTGTTLVERILAGHSALVSIGETSAFAAALRKAATSPHGLNFADLGARYAASAVAFGAPKDGPFIDKTLQNYLYCGYIHAALPDAKIVLVKRRPMDAGWAIFKAHFRGYFSFSYNQTDLAEYILTYRRLALHWQSVLPAHVYMEIDYEDIVADQAAASRRLIAFARLPWEDEVLRFHQSPAPSATASAVQVRRPVYSSSIGKWQFHAQHLAPLREGLARELAPEDLA